MMSHQASDFYTHVFHDTISKIRQDKQQTKQIFFVLLFSLFSKYSCLQGSKLIICQGSAPFLLKSLTLMTMSPLNVRTYFPKFKRVTNVGHGLFHLSTNNHTKDAKDKTDLKTITDIDLSVHPDYTKLNISQLIQSFNLYTKSN